MSSRQPSPGQLNVGQNASQVGRLQFKAKQPHIGGGLAQESDNMKYMAKYKELKRKVRETELDNDKLHYKVLQAKRNIQRMKLERAILYERLAAVPPSPELHDRQPLPSQPYHPQPSMDAEPGFVDYMRSHPTHRGGPAPDVANDPYLRSSRRDSANDARLMPPMQPPSSHTRSHSHTSPPGAKYSTSRPMYDRMPYPDNLPPVQHVLHSTPDRDRGRRQDLHDLSIPTHSHSSSLGPLSPPSDSRSTSSRTHNHQRIGPGTYVNRDDHRERTREIDLEREREWDIQRERRDIPVSRSRDMPPTSSAAHMRSPPNAHRQSRHSLEYADPRLRDDPGYYHELAGASGSAAPGYTMHSRSETPGSGSGGSGSGPPIPGGGELPSRPDSREQYYEHDRPRSFRLRPVQQQQQDDLDFVHEDGRTHSRDHGGGGGVYTSSTELGRSSSTRLDARKRRDADLMDMDETSGGGILYPGPKRYQQRDRPRGPDDQDDDRMAS